MSDQNEHIENQIKIKLYWHLKECVLEEYSSLQYIPSQFVLAIIRKGEN